MSHECIMIECALQGAPVNVLACGNVVETNTYPRAQGIALEV